MDVIRLGNSGDDVKTLQTLLNKLGERLPVDGQFGPMTKSAVERFQQSSGISVDGVVGLFTWTALKRKTDVAPSPVVPKEVKPETIESKAPVQVIEEKASETLAVLPDVIISCAKQYLNLMEVRDNAKWDNVTTPGPDAAADKLQARMKETGWQEGWPYCAAFAEAVVREALKAVNSEKYDIFAKNMTASCMESFDNFSKLGLISKTPTPGSVFFMQMGSSYRGHAGIVIAVDGNSLKTIEGNTSPNPDTPEADRNGDGVYAKIRPLKFQSKPNGLWLRGFLNPLT